MLNVSDTFQTRPRVAGKKGHARKLRADGWVPVVAYGPASQPRALAVDPKLFVLQRQRHGSSHIYGVQVEGGDSFRALVKAVQIHPVTRKLLHVDLYEVDMSRPIRVDVPIELTGKPAGLIEGGLLTQLLRLVHVQVLPDRVPAKILADVTALGLGDTLHLGQLQLPEGVKLMAHPEDPVAAVVEPEEAPAAAPAAAEAAAGGAAPGGAAPAAGAPAAKPADKK